MRDLKWSNAEKAIARKVFDQALQQELEAIIQKTKQRANRIEKPSQLWDLESYLGRARKKIDQRYDYRYSILPTVFASLILDGLLCEEDLRGLGEDKMRFIRSYLHICGEREEENTASASTS